MSTWRYITIQVREKILFTSTMISTLSPWRNTSFRLSLVQLKISPLVPFLRALDLRLLCWTSSRSWVLMWINHRLKFFVHLHHWNRAFQTIRVLSSIAFYLQATKDKLMQLHLLLQEDSLPPWWLQLLNKFMLLGRVPAASLKESEIFSTELNNLVTTTCHLIVWIPRVK